MGGELIEDEHPGTGQECAGQCQALALAPGQGLAALAHQGVVTVLEASMSSSMQAARHARRTWASVAEGAARRTLSAMVARMR